VVMSTDQERAIGYLKAPDLAGPDDDD